MKIGKASITYVQSLKKKAYVQSFGTICNTTNGYFVQRTHCNNITNNINYMSTKFECDFIKFR